MGKALSKDYYAILDTSPDATEAEIRRNYRRLALRYHPDRCEDPQGIENFRAVAEAYEVLRDPQRRQAYDAARTVRPPVREKPRPTRAGRSALTWVDAFFIQAGGIEAEGPGKGSLRRFSVRDLEEIWRAIVERLSASGESRQAIQRFQLLEHYIRRHPELSLPAGGEEHLAAKRALLDEFETLRRGTGIPWNSEPASLEDLLRVRRFAEARSLLIWRAAHDMARRFTRSALFSPTRLPGAPLRELAMLDRLESIAGGEPAQRALGHGYASCRRCGAWALVWGVGPPRCANCGSRRFALRARDERDELLQRLIGRSLPRFTPQIQRIRAAGIQSTERWLWYPLFTLCLLTMLPLFFFAGSALLSWFTLVLAATGWFAGAWNMVDIKPADTRLLFPGEWEVARKFAVGTQYTCACLLLAIGIGMPIFQMWTPGVSSFVGGALVFFGRDLRRLAMCGGRK